VAVWVLGSCIVPYSNDVNAPNPFSAKDALGDGSFNWYKDQRTKNGKQNPSRSKKNDDANAETYSAGFDKVVGPAGFFIIWAYLNVMACGLHEKEEGKGVITHDKKSPAMFVSIIMGKVWMACRGVTGKNVTRNMERKNGGEHDGELSYGLPGGAAFFLGTEAILLPFQMIFNACLSSFQITGKAYVWQQTKQFMCVRFAGDCVKSSFVMIMAGICGSLDDPLVCLKCCDISGHEGLTIFSPIRQLSPFSDACWAMFPEGSKIRSLMPMVIVACCHLMLDVLQQVVTGKAVSGEPEKRKIQNLNPGNTFWLRITSIRDSYWNFLEYKGIDAFCKAFLCFLEVPLTACLKNPVDDGAAFNMVFEEVMEMETDAEAIRARKDMYARERRKEETDQLEFLEDLVDGNNPHFVPKIKRRISHREIKIEEPSAEERKWIDGIKDGAFGREVAEIEAEACNKVGENWKPVYENLHFQQV
jgi:hypothetical protein